MYAQKCRRKMHLDPKMISESLIIEIVRAVGLKDNNFNHRLFWRLFRPVTDRLANIGLTFDRLIGEDGVPAAAEWILTQFCSGVKVRGAGNIPPEGPLLVVSNHPGACDSLIIFSKLKREDVKWIASDIPFLQFFPNVRKHQFCNSTTKVAARVSVMRDSIRHLKEGGALVFFGSGHMDFDPQVWRGASKMMENWIKSLDFLVRHVAELRLLPTVVSGVISPKWAHSMVTWLRRKESERYRLAVFAQVIYQLLFPGRLLVTPNISFGPSFSWNGKNGECSPGNVLPFIISREQALLADHCRACGIPLA